MEKLALKVLQKRISIESATELITGPSYILQNYLGTELPPDLSQPLPLVRYSTAICKMCNNRMSIPEYAMKYIGRQAVCCFCTDLVRANAQLIWFRSEIRKGNKGVYGTVNEIINEIIIGVINEVEFLLVDLD